MEPFWTTRKSKDSLGENDCLPKGRVAADASGEKRYNRNLSKSAIHESRCPMVYNLNHTIALLARTPYALNALLRDLPETWTSRNEGEDTWSAFDVAGHLIHAERTDWMPRAKVILQFGETRKFEPVDRWAQVREYEGKSLGQLLDEFARLRAENLAELHALNLRQEDFERCGRHPALGVVTLSELLATWAAHDLNHLHQISRIMAHQYREAVGPWNAYLGVLKCDGHSLRALHNYHSCLKSAHEENMPRTDGDFLKRLGVKFPIIQAPMGGGLTTPELVAAVCNAGGLGSLGAAYLKPDQILDEFRRIGALTDKPLNINLFVGGYKMEAVPDPGPMLALLGEIHETLGLPAPILPLLPPDPFPSQFEAVLEARPAIFSFTFGIPPSAEMKRLNQRGILAIGTATTVEEARLLEKAGVAAVVAQGAEAGAHRGTFLDSFESSMISTLDLVWGIRSAVSVPVIASGGLMDGRDIARTFALGASAAQLGTAFLPCPECGTPEAHRRAILSARADTTVVTRAFSGRPARGLRNIFIDKLHGREDFILPYPLQNALTRPMRTAAAKTDTAGFMSLWAGQGVTRARSLPASELIVRLIAEMKEAGIAIQ